MRCLYPRIAVAALASFFLAYLSYLNVSPGEPKFSASERGQPQPGERTPPGTRDAEQGLPRPRGGGRTAGGPHRGAPPANETRAGKYKLFHMGGPWPGVEPLLRMLMTDLPGDLLPHGGDCDVLFFSGTKFSAGMLEQHNKKRPPRPLRNPEVVVIVNEEFWVNEFVWKRMPRYYVTHALILGNWWNSTHAEYNGENVTSLWVPFGSLSFASRKLSTPMNFSNRANVPWRSKLQACSRNNLSHDYGNWPKLAVYMQQSCFTTQAGSKKPWNNYRETFWDELNLGMLEELNTRGTALAKCNGKKGLGMRFDAHHFPTIKTSPCGITRYDETMLAYTYFKVAVTLENTISDTGYITEKIVNALLAEAIPIYAGSRHISMLFNPKAHFLLEPGENDARVIASVIETLRNESLHASMLRESVVSDDAMVRFFSWHPAVWPTHGDSLRRRIVGELRRHCRGHSGDVHN